MKLGPLQPPRKSNRTGWQLHSLLARPRPRCVDSPVLLPPSPPLLVLLPPFRPPVHPSLKLPTRQLAAPTFFGPLRRDRGRQRPTAATANGAHCNLDRRGSSNALADRTGLVRLPRHLDPRMEVAAAAALAGREERRARVDRAAGTPTTTVDRARRAPTPELSQDEGLCRRRRRRWHPV